MRITSQMLRGAGLAAIVGLLAISLPAQGDRGVVVPATRGGPWVKVGIIPPATRVHLKVGGQVTVGSDRYGPEGEASGRHGLLARLTLSPTGPDPADELWEDHALRTMTLRTGPVREFETLAGGTLWLRVQGAVPAATGVFTVWVTQTPILPGRVTVQTGREGAGARWEEVRTFRPREVVTLRVTNGLSTSITFHGLVPSYLTRFGRGIVPGEWLKVEWLDRGSWVVFHDVTFDIAPTEVDPRENLTLKPGHAVLRQWNVRMRAGPGTYRAAFRYAPASAGSGGAREPSTVYSPTFEIVR